MAEVDGEADVGLDTEAERKRDKREWIERLKLGGLIVRWLAGVAWALASYFVVPLIAVNDLGPVEALRLSTRTFKERWGSTVRVNLRLGALGAAFTVVLVIGVVATMVCWSSSPILGALIGVGFAVVAVGLFVVMQALETYASVALYRFSVGLPVVGFDEGSVASLVVAK